MIILAGFVTFLAGLATVLVLFANGMRASPGEFIGRGFIWFAWILAVMLWGVAVAQAQDHGGHRPQDMDLHNRFYKTWMMPDNRAVSCCHDQDCRPAQAYEKDGKWYARQDGDDKPYTAIPPSKVEQERDSPDGRSHLCGRRYFFSGEFTVFCFLPAGGT